MSPQLHLTLVLTILIVIVLTMPLVRYLWIGWWAKKDDIMGGQNVAARQKYFEMFVRDQPAILRRKGKKALKKRLQTLPSPDADQLALETAFIRFDELYDQWYGRRLYLGPGLLLVVVGAVDAMLVLSTIFKTPEILAIDPTLSALSTAGIAALAGAYMWVVNDFIGRARRLDFSPSDVHWGVLRLTIALPLGIAFALLVKDQDQQAFIAFALGAFPLASLLTLLRRAATKYLGFEETKEQADDGIVKLQGVNRDILERLSNEDITTITQFAYCDPVRLTMRSNLSFNFVTDCMNQALAWVYLEDRLATLRCFGLKGAVEIKHLVDEMNESEPAQVHAKATFDAVVDVLKMNPAALRNAFDQIVEDPFTDYLYAVWD